MCDTNITDKHGTPMFINICAESLLGLLRRRYRKSLESMCTASGLERMAYHDGKCDALHELCVDIERMYEDHHKQQQQANER